MRTDVADLFTRVDQQIAALENTLPDADIPHPAAAILDSQRPAGELVDELRRYELSVLSASQRTADHLRETARTEADQLRTIARAEADQLRTTARSEADQLLAEARSEEAEIRARIAELEAVEHRLLGTIRDNLSSTPHPPAAPPGREAAHQTFPPAHAPGNGYPEDAQHRQPFG